MRAALGGLIAAVRTLSVLPLPGRAAEPMSAALPWFAVVGAALGAVLYGISALAAWPTIGGWPEVAALAVVIGGAVLTGALHLDGLADWADTLGGASAERRLEIMKDPRVGAFGVIAVVAIVLCKWVALTRLGPSGALWLVSAYAVSRTAMVDLAVRLPYARAEGGTAAIVVEHARPWHLVVCGLSALAVVIAVSGPAGVVALAFGWLIAALFGRWCRRRIGGVTGDLLGAASEIVETSILLLAAFALGWLSERSWTGVAAFGY